MSPSSRKLFDSPIFLAGVTGFYLTVFLVTNNISMLPVSSVVFIALALITPIVFVVSLISIVYRKMNKEGIVGSVSVFICTVYLLVALRDPILGLGFIQTNFNIWGGASSTVAKLSYLVPVLVLAGCFSLLFRRYIQIFTIALSVMTLTALAPNIKHLSPLYFVDKGRGNDQFSQDLLSSPLRIKPNIYLILADGYGSFSYMEENKIDVSNFTAYIGEKGFRAYGDVFSSYQPTTAAMSAMLNMEHHYYRPSRKFGEISKWGRKITGGKNQLVNYLKSNGYQIEYIHQTAYLLFHGCSADFCFPVSRFAGARTVLSQTLPGVLKHYISGKRITQDMVRQEVIRLIEEGNANSRPRFQYIHVYAPSHSSDDKVGICNEAQELEDYAERISNINTFLQKLVDTIISRDAGAVILISGDHGPYISENCAWKNNIHTLRDYRDRAGVVMAIRWPYDYDGRFDGKIRTTINVFRYLFAAMAESEHSVLKTLVQDDVFVRGTENVLKILNNGEVLIPPEPQLTE